MRVLPGLIVALVLASAAAAEIRPEDKRSDAATMSRELQTMQADDAANPGMLSVLDGEGLWREKPAGAPSCAECHHDAAASMRGVAARYPAWSAERDAPTDLAGQINLCRTKRQHAPAFPPESPELLALGAYVARQSRGLPIVPGQDVRMDGARARGRALFTARMGQLDLACATCHDDNWGRKLGGAPIPQAHPVGYPIYRLEWQAVGSLQRRFRNCMAGVRAEPFPYGAPEWIDLEAYLMQRAAGLAIEAPGVRP